MMRRLPQLLCVCVIIGVAMSALERKRASSTQSRETDGPPSIASLSKMHLQMERSGEFGASIPADRPLRMQHLDALLQFSNLLVDNGMDDYRSLAANALGTLGHQHGIPALLSVIRDETDDVDLRQECVVALSRIRDKRVVDYLIETLDAQTSQRDVRDVNYQAKDQLNKITGVAIGMGRGHPLETAADRKDLQAQWTAWWKQNRDAAYLRRSHATMSHPLFVYGIDEWKPERVRPDERPAAIDLQRAPEDSIERRPSRD